MARSPEIQARLHKEVDAFGGGLPGLDDLERFPYTEAAFNVSVTVLTIKDVERMCVMHFLQVYFAVASGFWIPLGEGLCCPEKGLCSKMSRLSVSAFSAKIGEVYREVTCLPLLHYLSTQRCLDTRVLFSGTITDICQLP